MAKIGEYYYPDIDIEEAIKYAKTIYDFPSHSMSVSMLAEKHGLKLRGGWTGMILSSLRKYNLIEGRGTLRSTNLAEKIINPKDQFELQSAKAIVFDKIDLWRRIHSDYGEKVPSSDFWAYLAEKFTIDRVEAKEKAEKVAKIYTESLGFCFPSGASAGNIEEDRREMVIQDGVRDLKASMFVNPILGELRTEEYGVLKIKDTVSIETAITLLQSLKEKLKINQAGGNTTS